MKSGETFQIVFILRKHFSILFRESHEKWLGIELKIRRHCCSQQILGDLADKWAVVMITEPINRRENRQHLSGVRNNRAFVRTIDWIVDQIRKQLLHNLLLSAKSIDFCAKHRSKAFLKRFDSKHMCLKVSGGQKGRHPHANSPARFASRRIFFFN